MRVVTHRIMSSTVMAVAETKAILLKNIKDHSFGKMTKAKLSVTFCTDNRTVSSTTVSDEIAKAVEAFPLGSKELKDIVIYGFKRSFFPGSYLEKREYVRRIINYYNRIEADFGINGSKA